MRQYRDEMRRMHPKEREAAGKAVLGMSASKAGRKFHYHLVRFSRDKAMQRSKIAVGDLILVSKKDPLRSDLSGTVVKRGKRFIEAAFENPLPKWAFKSALRLDLYMNDIPYKRMREFLQRFEALEGKDFLKALLTGRRKQQPATYEAFTPFDSRLNESQKQAVGKVLGSRDLFLIHGPPGTGKTSTLCEAARQCAARGEQVLITADSNIAADTILEKLVDSGVRSCIRVGHPARILEHLEHHSLAALFERHDRQETLRSLQEECNGRLEQRNAYIKPTPGRKRGMSENRIKTLAAKNASQRGVDAATMRSMARWLAYNEKVDTLMNKIRDLENMILNNIIDSMDVVVTTNSMAASDLLEDRTFDVALIDEGSQQIEPSTLIPLQKAKRWIMAGDHMQLPPTVVSREASALEKTLFERFMHESSDNAVMLQTQYRMNDTLLEFIKREFYGNRLRSDPGVAAITPRQLCAKLDWEIITVIDTSGSEEQKSGNEHSYRNEREADAVLHRVKQMVDAGVDAEAIGVITFYQGQVKMLDKIFQKHGLSVEVNSVDGFQGREKEIIVLSTVRSNEKGKIGFLKDYRRLNVAISRAKRKLVVAGALQTLQNDPLYGRWIAALKGSKNCVIKPPPGEGAEG